MPAGVVGFILALPSMAFPVVADRIMAVVNNEVIALSDVRTYRELFVRSPDADDITIVGTLIDQKLLLADAKKLEIRPPSSDEVATAFEELRGRFQPPETFETLKDQLLLTDTDIKQQLWQQLHIRKLIEQRIHFFIFVTPDDIESYYQENLEEFSGQDPEAARKAIQKIRVAEKARSKLENYLDRLRERADFRINRPRPE